ncbi:phosphate signaling complex protein PhoU [candidate division KSB1 bacterium]|nr:phosphate signaling complex protein PhoU [candidate division KSB1 bacterium]
MEIHTASHFEESLQRDMALICQTVHEMAKRDENALRNALTALTEFNRQLAYAVILRDRFIDELETRLDQLCLEFFVRQQPVAGHLRFVFSTIKIVRDLERIGDYAENISRQVIFLASIDPALDQTKYLDRFIELANLSIKMFQDGIEAFIQRDSKKAREIMEIENQADIIRSKINNQLIGLRQQDIIPLEALTPLLTVARRFERVTDQVKNICEEIIYMTTGEILKHKGSKEFNILFIDEDNSCFSQMAEGIGKSMNLSQFSFTSAGYKSAQPISPQLVEFMDGKGIDISGQQAKTLEQISEIEHIEIMIAMVPDLRNIIPPTATKTIKLNWSMRNYCEAPVDESTRTANFEKAYSYLYNQINELVQAILGVNNDKQTKK